MASEGALRAERIRRGIKSLATERGDPLQDLFEVAYLLVGALACHEFQMEDRLKRAIDELFDGDETSLPRRIQAITGALSNAIGSRMSHDFPSGHLQGHSIVEVAGLVRRDVDGLGLDGLRQVVDTLFYEQFTRAFPSDRVHHAIVAHLAKPLIQRLGSVTEMQLGPGELLISSGAEVYAYANENASGLTTERWARLQFMRDVRFAVHGVGGAVRRVMAFQPTLTVLDRTLRFRREAENRHPRLPAAQALLEQVYRQPGGIVDGVMIVISDRERSLFHRAQYERRYLFINEHLRAVIAFPSIGESGKPTVCTALYFHERPIAGHEGAVAHVDLRQLHISARTEEAQRCASLAGTLVECWHQGRVPSKEMLEATLAPRRILAFVEEGLKQTDGNAIPGLFRLVTRNELVHHEYSLRVEDYIERRTDTAWRPKVQIDPIMDCLEDGQAEAAVYLIGNNGAGKSLALSDVAMALAQQGRHSFGVSFGTTDRFEQSAGKEPLRTHFTYAGARTSRAGTAPKAAMGQLGDMVKGIYQAPHRLDCFEEALSMLGFERRQYLVRMATRSTADPLDLLLAEVHELTRFDSQVSLDEPTWRSLDDGQYKIAVVRRESGEVVVFDSLSSGEQQVLTIVIKIVSGLRSGTTVLLDEPEISLHVAWQRQLPQLLRSFSAALQCSFVVATHSPIVIASAVDSHDYCFTMSAGLLSQIMPAERRSVEASLFEGFNTYTRHTHHIQERCAEIVSQVIAQAEEATDALDETNVATQPPNLDEHPQVKELVSLQKRLTRARGDGSEQDLALIKSAIAAVREVLTP